MVGHLLQTEGRTTEVDPGTGFSAPGQLRCSTSPCQGAVTLGTLFGRALKLAVVPHRQEPGVAPDAQTDTYAAATFFVDNWRWAKVPFYIRTGKRLPKRSSEVAIQFKDVPQILFNAHPDVPLESNVLTIRVQPEEGLALRIGAKLPGPKVRIYPVKMEFNYNTSFGGSSPEAYERLILDDKNSQATQRCISGTVFAGQNHNS